MPPKEMTVTNQELRDVLPSNFKWTSPHLLSLNFRLVFVVLCGASMGFDSSMVNSLQTLDTWTSYFNHPSSSLLGITNAVLNIAPIVFAAPVVWFSDRFGRLKTVQLGCFVLIFASAFQAASQNLGMFVASRFLIGIGIELCMVCGPVLVTEVAYPTHRSKLSSLIMPCFFVGAIISSWTVFGTYRMNKSTWTWRIPSLLQAALPLLQFFVLFWVPESPRWLMSKGRVEEARAIIVKYHGGGDENCPLVDYQINQIETYLATDSEYAKLPWSKLWETISDRRRLALIVYMAFMTQMCGNALISYYLTLILNTIGIRDSTRQTLVNGILQIFNFLVALCGASLVDRVGRRALWLFAVSLMLLAFIAWTVCSALFERNTTDRGLATSVLACVFLFQLGYASGITPLSLTYPAEILPFHSRQKGMGIVFICNSIALIFNNMVNPIALENIGWKYYMVFVAILAQWLVVVFFLFPETRGYSLEEMSSIFNGPVSGLRSSKKIQVLTSETEIHLGVEKGCEKEAEVQHVEASQINKDPHQES